MRTSDPYDVTVRGMFFRGTLSCPGGTDWDALELVGPADEFFTVFQYGGGGSERAPVAFPDGIGLDLEVVEGLLVHARRVLCVPRAVRSAWSGLPAPSRSTPPDVTVRGRRFRSTLDGESSADTRRLEVADPSGSPILRIIREPGADAPAIVFTVDDARPDIAELEALLVHARGRLGLHPGREETTHLGPASDSPTTVPWPDGVRMPPEIGRLHALRMTDFDAWRLLVDSWGESRQRQVFEGYPETGLVPFAMRVDGGDVACWQLDTGEVAIVPWLEDPVSEEKARFADIWAFLEDVLLPEFLARHRHESADERRERGLPGL